MTRDIITTPETVAFTAARGSARVTEFLPATRENVYRVRHMIRRYTRKGYHVHAAINHGGRLVSNVWESDIYTQARRRKEAQAWPQSIMRSCTLHY